MEKRRVVMIEGDGIGPEICAAVRTAIAATGAPIEWVMAEAGLGCLERHGNPLSLETLVLFYENRVGIKGPTMTPAGEGHRSVNVRLREKLLLFAGVRPVQTIPGLVHPLSALARTVDLVIIRENLEDLYAGHEILVSGFEKVECSSGTTPRLVSIERARQFTGTAFTAGTVVALKVITPERTKRITRFAFEYARAHRRRKVTCVHKANILKETDGLFLSIFREIARDYPDIVADDFLMDAAAMRLVRTPEQFDVLVCPNLYGDILSDLCAALVGGLGVVPGANIGTDIALFEAVHGTAPDIAGQGKANPTALLLSACMMLEHLAALDARTQRDDDERFDYGSAAAKLRTAIANVIRRGEHVTPDIWTSRLPALDEYIPPDVQAEIWAPENERPKPASTARMAQAIAEEYGRLYAAVR